MEEVEPLELDIRLATSDDFDILTGISRICFPEQLRWKASKSHNSQFWDKLINSDYCEMYVCNIYGQVVAYIALVFDKIKYEEIWENQNLGFYDNLYIFVKHPMQYMKRACTTFQLKRKQKLQKSLNTSKNKKKQNTYAKIRKHFSENTPWLGPYALLPSMYGKGISVEIHEHCFHRVKELGCKSVYAAIEIENKKSRGLINKLGFKSIDEVDNVKIYKKNLD